MEDFFGGGSPFLKRSRIPPAPLSSTLHRSSLEGKEGVLYVLAGDLLSLNGRCEEISAALASQEDWVLALLLKCLGN